MRRTVGASRIAWALLLAMLVIGRPVVADEAPTLTTRLAEADRLLAAGELRQAQSMLEVLQAQLPPDAPPEQRAAVSARLGAVLGETGEDERRWRCSRTRSSWRRARGSLGCRPKRSTTWAMCSCAPMRSAALASYRASATLAESARLPRLRVRALVNAARAETLGGEGEAAAASLRQASDLLDTMPADQDDSLERLAAAGQALELARRDRDYLELADRLQRLAQTSSEASGDRRSLSWSAGLRGELYALAGRDDEALGLYRQAALDAEQARAPELLFRWQWLSGRVLAAQGRNDEAITAYRSAVRNLELVRLDLPAFDARTGRSLFRETLGPVFTELADLLLQEAQASDGDVRQVDLVQARATIEQLKTVELEDYFKDDCAADLTSRQRPLDRPGDRTAVLYPVLLADRTELVLSLPDGRLVSARTPATGAEVTEAAQAFRQALQTNQPSWLRSAIYLYDQLIRPIEPLLTGRWCRDPGLRARWRLAQHPDRRAA